LRSPVEDRDGHGSRPRRGEEPAEKPRLEVGLVTADEQEIRSPQERRDQTRQRSEALDPGMVRPPWPAELLVPSAASSHQHDPGADTAEAVGDVDCQRLPVKVEQGLVLPHPPAPATNEHHSQRQLRNPVFL
jgi:hypothetical protein